MPAGSCSYHRLVEKHICAHKSKTLWLLIPRPGWSAWQSGLYEGERKSRLSWNRSQQDLWRIFSIRVTISGKRHSNVFFSALSTTSRVSSASVLFETNLISNSQQQEEEYVFPLISLNDHNTRGHPQSSVDIAGPRFILGPFASGETADLRLTFNQSSSCGLCSAGASPWVINLQRQMLSRAQTSVADSSCSPTYQATLVSFSTIICSSLHTRVGCYSENNEMKIKLTCLWPISLGDA